MLADEFVANVRTSGYKAFSELGDRLEGKPAQTIQGDPDNPLGFGEIVVRVVDPKA